ncbi:MAG: cation transporter [Gemmatimonadota bacterium]|nr:cation transporter [Gemmatimonadota bacterium]
MGKPDRPEKKAGGTVSPGRSQERFQALMRASLIAIGADAFLILLKFLMAYLTGSTVIFADGWHSLADLGVSFTVMLSIIANNQFKGNIRARQVEGVVALLISLVLLFGGFSLVRNVFASGAASYNLATGIPLIIAFTGISIACVVSFTLSRFKRQVGRKWDSLVFHAEGMHTLSDFYTSLGVWGTLLLGYFGVNIEKWMTLIVGLVVLKIGIQIFFKSLHALNIPNLLTTLRVLDIAKMSASIIKKATPAGLREPVVLFFKNMAGIYNKTMTYLTRLGGLPEQWLIEHSRLVFSWCPP